MGRYLYNKHVKRKSIDIFDLEVKHGKLSESGESFIPR